MTLEKLMGGNQRFAGGTDPGSLARLCGGQEPHACVVACSDSRVVPERIFDARRGEIFVIRTAGNVVLGPSAMGSVEYAVEHLNVPVVMVLGHSECGAVTAAMDASPPGHCGRLVDSIKEMGIDGTLDEMIEKNARRQVQELLRRSPPISMAQMGGRIQVVAALYDLATGKVRILD